MHGVVDRSGDADEIVTHQALGHNVPHPPRRPSDAHVRDPLRNAAHDLAARGDVNLDIGARVLKHEAHDQPGEHVVAEALARRDTHGADAAAAELRELFLEPVERGQDERRVPRQQLARVGQPRAASAPLDQPVRDRRLERPEMRRGGRLSHRACPRRGGDRPVPLDLHQQAQPKRVEDAAQM